MSSKTSSGYWQATKLWTETDDLVPWLCGKHVGPAALPPLTNTCARSLGPQGMLSLTLNPNPTSQEIDRVIKPNTKTMQERVAELTQLLDRLSGAAGQLLVVASFAPEAAKEKVASSRPKGMFESMMFGGMARQQAGECVPTCRIRIRFGLRRG